MNLEKEVTIIGVRRLDYITKDNQEVKGTQVFAIGNSVDEENVKGCLPTKTWFPLSAYEKYENLTYPVKAIAVYDIDMEKTKLKIVDFKITK